MKPSLNILPSPQKQTLLTRREAKINNNNNNNNKNKNNNNSNDNNNNNNNNNNNKTIDRKRDKKSI